MLQHIPGWLGAALRDVRAGHAGLTVARAELGLAGANTPSIDLSSPAFAAGARLPVRFTADGAGASPPLVWGDVPPGTAALALIVEDADAPTPRPVVHAVLWNLPADARRLEEGAIRADGTGGQDGRDVGRNSFGGEGWLPPDPPTGHGVHDYVFQLFALSGSASGTNDVEDPGASPGRTAFTDAIAGRVLAAGVLVGTYSRGEEAPITGMESSAIGSAAPA